MDVNGETVKAEPELKFLVDAAMINFEGTARLPDAPAIKIASEQINHIIVRPNNALSVDLDIDPKGHVTGLVTIDTTKIGGTLDVARVQMDLVDVFAELADVAELKTMELGLTLKFGLLKKNAQEYVTSPAELDIVFDRVGEIALKRQ